jgi:hypothetical protein
MKIEGPSKTSATSKTGKTERAADGGVGFDDYMAAGAKATSAPATSSAIARVDALLAAQAVEDPAERSARKRMQTRAEGVLGELDRLKIALLTGQLTLGHVIDIADVVASHREKINDPRLTAILDEVDLRAQIEIAKARKAMESRG